MQQFRFIDIFIDLFECALHVSGDKLAHLQEHFFDCIYSFGTTQRWQGHRSAAISVHCTKAVFIHSFIHSCISILPERPGWQEPEPSHVTGLALAHCILGKFLRVVCHCFPPPLDVPTFAARCLYVCNDARDPSSERWNCGREIVR